MDCLPLGALPSNVRVQVSNLKGSIVQYKNVYSHKFVTEFGETEKRIFNSRDSLKLSFEIEMQCVARRATNESLFM